MSDNITHFPGCEPQSPPLDQDSPMLKQAKLFFNQLLEGVYGHPQGIALVMETENGWEVFAFTDEDLDITHTIGQLEMGKLTLAKMALRGDD